MKQFDYHVQIWIEEFKRNPNRRVERWSTEACFAERKYAERFVNQNYDLKCRILVKGKSQSAIGV